MNTNRARRAAIEAILTANITSLEVWQNRPYTAVKLTTKYDGLEYTEVGFAKAHWPDKWDADFGIELATRKVIASISKAIVNGDGYKLTRCPF